MSSSFSRSCSEPEHPAGPGVAVGDVVWCKVDNNYPPWPCKVTKVEEGTASLESFQDKLDYDKPLHTLTPFTKLVVAKMVRTGRKKLKRKKTNLELFEQAVKDAIGFIKSTGGEVITEEDVNAIDESNASYSSIDTTSNSFSCTASAGVSGSYPTDILTTSSHASPFVSKRKKSSGSPEETNGEPKRHCSEVNQRLLGYSVASYDALVENSLFNISTPAISARRRSSSSPSSHHSVPIKLITSTPKDAASNSIESSSINSHTPSFHSISVQSTASDSDDETDELPVVDLSAKEIIINNLKKNDLLWVKQGSHPFWPSLLSNIVIKTKRIQVYFLGWSDKEPTGITGRFTGKKKNIASYSTAERDSYIKAGLSSAVKEEFKLSLQEAEKLLQLRLTKEIQGAPFQQMMELIKRRPRYKDCTFSVKEPLEAEVPAATSSTPGQVMSAFGFDIGKEQKSLFDHGEEEEESESNHEDEGDTTDSDAEDERGLYSFKRIQQCFEECKAELVGICKKEVQSDLHHDFIEGNIKEKRSLRMIEKFGPGAFLTDSKKSKLLDQLLEVTTQVTGETGNFPYAYDVLLPEAIVRAISKVENCSLPVAWEKFNEYQ